MHTLPQLIEEDVQQLEEALRDFLKKTDASVALINDQGGFLIAHQGDSSRFDLTSIAALASGAYMATQTIAGLVQEAGFSNVYQQGQTHSIFTIAIDSQCLLVVIFEARVGVGVVKYYATGTVRRIAGQMQKAQDRDPGAGLDLAALNIADTADIFRRK